MYYTYINVYGHEYASIFNTYICACTYVRILVCRTFPEMGFARVPRVHTCQNFLHFRFSGSTTHLSQNISCHK